MRACTHCLRLCVCARLRGDAHKLGILIRQFFTKSQDAIQNSKNEEKQQKKTEKGPQKIVRNSIESMGSVRADST